MAEAAIFAKNCNNKHYQDVNRGQTRTTAIARSSNFPLCPLHATVLLRRAKLAQFF